MRIEKNGKVRRAGRSSRACVALEEYLRLSPGSPMAVRVILPTFGKSRKTTKSDPSTGDQLGKREFLFKPVSTKFRAVVCRPVGKRRE